MKKERGCCSDNREIKKRQSCKIAEISRSAVRGRSKKYVTKKQALIKRVFLKKENLIIALSSQNKLLIVNRQLKV